MCGVDRPGRIAWRGVTYLEEHELAPTYEVFLTGCSLRCSFCSMADAVAHPDVGEWLAPSDLAAAIAAPNVPPFRAVALVGGEPGAHRPYVRRLVPALRARLPRADLALNTNLFLPERFAAEDAESFDWIVGDLHFWGSDCAARLAGYGAYPAVARRYVEALLAAGGRLILRLLVLPGHLKCCLGPSVEWAAGLEGDIRLHLMLNYAPFGADHADSRLAEPLSPEEARSAELLVPLGLARAASAPLPGFTPRPAGLRDPEVVVDLDPAGRTRLPFVTADLLPWVVAHHPEHADRLVYLEEESDAR